MNEIKKKSILTPEIANCPALKVLIKLPSVKHEDKKKNQKSHENLQYQTRRNKNDFSLARDMLNKVANSNESGHNLL